MAKRSRKIWRKNDQGEKFHLLSVTMNNGVIRIAPGADHDKLSRAWRVKIHDGDDTSVRSRWYDAPGSWSRAIQEDAVLYIKECGDDDEFMWKLVMAAIDSNIQIVEPPAVICVPTIDEIDDTTTHVEVHFDPSRVNVHDWEVRLPNAGVFYTTSETRSSSTGIVDLYRNIVVASTDNLRDATQSIVDAVLAHARD